MNCSIGTVKSTIHAAIGRLGLELHQEEPDVTR
jgi:DNA-directed RNA polymerase specialized sigma24 family protein